MAITELIFGQPVRVRIGDPLIPTVGMIQFDASLEEEHSSQVEVTDHPVEALTGVTTDISDNVRVLPDSITIHGVVTDTPLVFLASLTAPSPVFAGAVPEPPTTQRADAAYAKLRELKNKGALLTVVTSLRTYTDMVITSVVVSRNAAMGHALDCTVSLREVKTATSLALEGPVPNEVANKAKEDLARTAKDGASRAQSEAGDRAMNSMLESGASLLFG